MGNIGHRKINSNYPSSNNLDNPSTKSGDNINDNSTEQFNSSYDPKKESLLQLTLSNNVEIQQVLANISLYSKQSQMSTNGGYASISSLKEYYKVDKEGYCTKQQIFYLIFQGCSCCGLKDQFGVRKMLAKKFTDQEIISILKTYLAGVYIYIKQFKRNIQKIDFNDIGFQIFNTPNNFHPLNQNQTNISQSKRKIRIFFIEPWLREKKDQQTISVNSVNILLQNPSPQRLKQNQTAFTEYLLQMQKKGQNEFQKIKTYQKQYFSLLFSIGVIGLKLLEMGFVDDIYMRSPNKKVNLQKIQSYLEKFQTGGSKSNNLNKMTDYDYSVSRKKLIGGLKILLLSNSPQERQKIFEFWSIKLDEINYLDEINLQYSDHFENGREEPKLTQRVQRHPINQKSSLPHHSQHQIGRSTANNLSGKLYEVQKSQQKGTKAETELNGNRFTMGQNINTPYSHANLTEKNTHYNWTKTQNLNSKNYVYKLDQLKHQKTIDNHQKMNTQKYTNPVHQMRENHYTFNKTTNNLERLYNIPPVHSTNNYRQPLVSNNSQRVQNGNRLNDINQNRSVPHQPFNSGNIIPQDQYSIHRPSIHGPFQFSHPQKSKQNANIIFNNL